MVKRKTIFQIAATYVGSIVGAGFASGQELLQFFVVFSAKGQIGILVAGIFFAILGYLIAKIVITYKILGYQLFLHNILGKKLGTIIDIWIGITTFLTISIMLAGCATVLYQYYSLNYLLGLLVSGMLMLFTLLKGEGGVLGINSLLIPMLIVITVVISIMSFFAGTGEVFAADNNSLIGRQWLKSTILYVAYNIVISLLILSSINSIKLNDGLMGTILGGFVLGGIGLIMISAMLPHSPEILSVEMPMLFLADKVHKTAVWFYTPVLLMAMLTTAVANGYGLIARLKDIAVMSYPQLAVVLVIMSIPVALLGFGSLISHLYPVFGYIGLVLLCGILYKSIVGKLYL
ncbi:MAG: hypothetical protein AB1420_04545 [Bacillota bacterium]